MRTRFRQIMAEEPFPCFRVNLGNRSHAETLRLFLQHRQNERWVLLGSHAVQSDLQLWTAWIQTTRNELRQSMVARSRDAEFLRYLAGTHHVSEAFSRAGLQEGQTSAWLVYLLLAQAVENDLGHIQPISIPNAQLHDEVQHLARTLHWTIESSDITFSIEGARTLGIAVEEWTPGRISESVVAHVLMADDLSSSHR